MEKGEKREDRNNYSRALVRALEGEEDEDEQTKEETEPQPKG